MFNSANTWVSKDTENQIILQNVDFYADLTDGGLAGIIDDINYFNNQGYYEYYSCQQEYLERNGFEWEPDVKCSLDKVITHYHDDEETNKEYYGTVIFRNEQALKDFLEGLAMYNVTNHMGL